MRLRIRPGIVAAALIWTCSAAVLALLPFVGCAFPLPVAVRLDAGPDPWAGFMTVGGVLLYFFGPWLFAVTAAVEAPAHHGDMSRGPPPCPSPPRASMTS